MAVMSLYGYIIFKFFIMQSILAHFVIKLSLRAVFASKNEVNGRLFSPKVTLGFPLDCSDFKFTSRYVSTNLEIFKYT